MQLGPSLTSPQSIPDISSSRSSAAGAADISPAEIKGPSTNLVEVVNHYASHPSALIALAESQDINDEARIRQLGDTPYYVSLAQQLVKSDAGILDLLNELPSRLTGGILSGSSIEIKDILDRAAKPAEDKSDSASVLSQIGKLNADAYNGIGLFDTGQISIDRADFDAKQEPAGSDISNNAFSHPRNLRPFILDVTFKLDAAVKAIEANPTLSGIPPEQVAADLIDIWSAAGGVEGLLERLEEKLVEKSPALAEQFLNSLKPMMPTIRDFYAALEGEPEGSLSKTGGFGIPAFWVVRNDAGEATIASGERDITECFPKSSAGNFMEKSFAAFATRQASTGSNFSIDESFKFAGFDVTLEAARLRASDKCPTAQETSASVDLVAETASLQTNLESLFR